ncbi:RNA polymerase sigma-70 factor (ECF subfamily) [Mucilaginibacter gracilis]|uniref:RNA polymerase sigma-70 factor (ECF subfamily) n=1 Tax=Mucilaginibacter gracilis TaxID=423350 RepID=A0A495J5K9_9SPHI|nr:RNA polymerase sigma-70 factor [Mucilaginibacter gracilis]RKR84011.1 RNA polymerase sigma-70 factor (ECF subfamily) [Mucilaginibacter gracilis]
MDTLSALSDQQLYILFRQGNGMAYTEIYHRYKGILHLHAYKKLGDFEEAKDVVQELFTLLWNGREALPDTDNFSGYLYQSLRNRIFNVISHKKVKSRYADSITQVFNEGYVITDHLVREKQLALSIEAEIANLPPKMQQVFLLSRKSYLSHKEIAQELSISESTVKNQIKSALKILRTKLELLILMGIVFFIDKV